VINGGVGSGNALDERPQFGDRRMLADERLSSG
jgi:hypothetical protein